MAFAIEEGEAKKHVILNLNLLLNLHDANSLRFKHFMNFVEHDRTIFQGQGTIVKLLQ